jgi:hypothetical protein
MDVRDLVRSIVSGDLLAARQWVADARRAQVRWEQCEQPAGLSGRELAIAAGLVELFAERDGTTPPPWTRRVGPEQDLVILDPGLETMPRSFARARAFGPESLRKRNLIALPDFLDVA